MQNSPDNDKTVEQQSDVEGYAIPHSIGMQTTLGPILRHPMPPSGPVPQPPGPAVPPGRPSIDPINLPKLA
jgi:hypothetical protein